MCLQTRQHTTDAAVDFVDKKCLTCYNTRHRTIQWPFWGFRCHLLGLFFVRLQAENPDCYANRSTMEGEWPHTTRASLALLAAVVFFVVRLDDWITMSSRPVSKYSVFSMTTHIGVVSWLCFFRLRMSSTHDGWKQTGTDVSALVVVGHTDDFVFFCTSLALLCFDFAFAYKSQTSQKKNTQ